MNSLPHCTMTGEPSRETLRDAYAHLQRLRLRATVRGHLRNLPADLDAALADQHFGPVLKEMARQRLRERAEKLHLRLPCLRFDASTLPVLPSLPGASA